MTTPSGFEVDPSAYSNLQQDLTSGGYTGVPQLGVPGGSIGVNPDDPSVFLGIIKHYDSDTPHHPSLTDYWQNVTKTEDTATVSQMFENLDKMSIKEQHKLYMHLLIAGYSSTTLPLDKIAEQVKTSAFPDLVDSYTRFLQDLSDRYMNRGQQITPDDLLEDRIAYRFKWEDIDWNGNLNGLNLNTLLNLTGGEESLAGTTTATYTSKDFMDPMDAKALVRATLQRELGRDPTAAEYEDFISAIHGAEANDPSKVTQTTTTDEQGRTISSNSITHQGMTQQGIGQLALERAQRQPDWAEWQAMGIYAPAMMQALGSTVPGV